MHNSLQRCASNERVVDSLIYDVQVFINNWQAAADRGYGLCSCWGNITQSLLSGFDAFCQWLPKSFATRAVAYTIMAGTMAVWLMWRLGEIAAQWWQSQGCEFTLELLQTASCGAVMAGLVALMVFGVATGTCCLAWRWGRRMLSVAGGMGVRWLDAACRVLLCYEGG